MDKDFRKAVTIFIDILGSQDRESFAEWLNIMEIFNAGIEREKRLDESHPWTAYKRDIHMFSDCAYIIYDYKNDVEDVRKDMNALMCIACYNTEKLVHEFFKNGFIVRGAITYGDIYYETDRNIWFGPAMNNAFYLESQIAKYPRIVIDPKYADGLWEYNEQNYRSDIFQQEMNGEIIKKDDDGLSYLNSFNSILYYNYANEIINRLWTLCQIEKNKERDNQILQASIKKKYEWLEEKLMECFELDVRG